MRGVLGIVGALLLTGLCAGCTSDLMAVLKMSHTHKALDEWNSLVAELGTHIQAYENSPSFMDSDRTRAIEVGTRLLELVEAHPDIVPGIVEQSRIIGDHVRMLERSTIAVVEVDARTGAETGIKLEPGWHMRIDVLGGEWQAGDPSRWPPNAGIGYPDYSPGFLTDFRYCRGVSMGALIGKMGDRCFGAGEWFQNSVDRAGLLQLMMNDNTRSDNAGLLRVRYIVRKTETR